MFGCVWQSVGIRLVAAAVDDDDDTPISSSSTELDNLAFLEGPIPIESDNPRFSPTRYIGDEDVHDDRNHPDPVPPLSNIPGSKPLFYELLRIEHDTYKPEGPP